MRRHAILQNAVLQGAVPQHAAQQRAVAQRAAAKLAACLLSLPLLALAPIAATKAQPTRYALDPVHTRVSFSVSHAGFSSAIGTVSGSTGELWFDPQDWSSARLQATVPMARADMGDAKWNKATLARNLLDVERYPQASFVSTRIEPRDPTHAAVFGTLTLRGVSRKVRLEVTLNAAKRHPMPPFRRTVGFSATTTLSRKDFGIDAWPSMIGDTVEIRIEAEATRSRNDDGTPADDIPTDKMPTDSAPTDSVPAVESDAGNEIQHDQENQDSQGDTGTEHSDSTGDAVDGNDRRHNGAVGNADSNTDHNTDENAGNTTGNQDPRP